MKALARSAPSAPDLVASKRALRHGSASRRTLDGSVARVARALEVAPDAIPWAEIDRDRLALIRETLERAHLAPSTIRQTISDVRGIVRAAYLQGLVDDRQLEGLRDVRVTGSRVTKGRALSHVEVGALLTRCDDLSAPRGPMLRAVLLVALGTGLRLSELCTVAVRCLDPRGELHVIGKGNKENVCPLEPATRKALDAWLAVRPASWNHGRLFASPVRGRPLQAIHLWRLLRALAQAAGVDAFSPHDLRRTFATRMFEAGLELGEVQSLMNHADPRTTKRYDKRDRAALVRRRQEVSVYEAGS